MTMIVDRNDPRFQEANRQAQEQGWDGILWLIDMNDPPSRIITIDEIEAMLNDIYRWRHEEADAVKEQGGSA